jgi:hypothetical protein
MDLLSPYERILTVSKLPHHGGRRTFGRLVIARLPRLVVLRCRRPNAEAPPGAPQRRPASAAASDSGTAGAAGTVIRLA